MPVMSVATILPSFPTCSFQIFTPISDSHINLVYVRHRFNF